MPVSHFIRWTKCAEKTRQFLYHIMIMIITGHLANHLSIVSYLSWSRKCTVVPPEQHSAVLLHPLTFEVQVYGLLKGHGNEADFLGFLHKSVRIGPAHYIASRSDFDFEFTEIFVIEKRLPDSPSRRVGESTRMQVDKRFQTFEPINGVSTLQPRLLFG